MKCKPQNNTQIHLKIEDKEKQGSVRKKKEENNESSCYMNSDKTQEWS